MADVPIICPKCEKEMHAGFVPDYSDGVVLERRWVEGKFATRWLGLRPVSYTHLTLPTILRV